MTRRPRYRSAPEAHGPSVARPHDRGVGSVFEKVRRDHAAETAEDYVEAVSDIIHGQGECRVKDLAAYMGVSHVTVTRIVARLQAADLLTTEPYQPIRLTAKGDRLAAASRRRHEVVLSFLLALGVPEDDARRDAEGIEHHVGASTLRQMSRFASEHIRGAGE
jgi:DtxR family manganese transport transcriptional regulator